MAHTPSVTSWQHERDGLLDYISHVESCRTRAQDYMLNAVRQEMMPEFEVAEVLLLLFEARDESEKRRWGQGGGESG